jgi:hypothetical protein
MIRNNLFFHVGTLTMDPCFQLKEAHAEAMRTTLCPACAHPRPDATAIDVWLQEDRSPHDRPLNFLYGCGIGLIHREMLELLENNDLTRDLYFGRVYNNRGEECAKWQTFHARHTLIVRGSNGAEYRTCNECGRNIYHATGKSHLFPAPPGDATIFGSNEAGLVVPAGIAARVKAKKWRKVSIDELPVVEVPADGFGLLPYRETTS